MKIISVIRNKSKVVPDIFTIGESPDGQGPPVQDINYYETGAFSGKAYRGGCYIVTFSNSTVKRIIPASCVIDIAVETSKDNAVAIPPLPD